MTDAAELSQLKRALVALKEMRARLDSVEKARTEPIAIIGIGCRFPGGADSPEAYWQILMDGVDAISEIPADRWPVDELFHDDFMAPGKTNTRWGGFLDQVDQFDPAFFGITPREAARMDPQQRLLLQTAVEALENAGQPLEKLSGSQTGVFVGIHSHSNDYDLLQVQNLADIDTHTGTGTAHSIVANRLSYLFDWQGPSLTVDTACSSSLISTHLAVNSLRNGECDLALAAGVNLVLTPESTVTFSKLQMMSPNGRCHTFDARADGFVRGEGVGIVVLKRLSDALAAGDPIIALIAGTAVNQDGNSNGITAPNGLAQQAVIRQALANAKIEPAQVSYVETHGTGTRLGDPIEVEALAEAIGAPGDGAPACILGAVKTNIGHLEGAAGIAGLIKTALVLRHEIIPPNLHFQNLNPLIALDHTRFEIPMQPRPYPQGEQPRYAGVSSFGFGGTNAHLILTEAPPSTAQPAPMQARPYLLPLSGRSPAALRDLAQSWRALLAGTTDPLPDIVYTAARRRTHHDHRLAVVGADNAELRRRLDAYLANDDPDGFAAGQVISPDERGLVFVFSGQGPQWANMGRELLETEPVFRERVTEIDRLLQQYAAWSLLKELTDENGRLDDTEVAQPAIFALQVGLAALWQSWGIVPEAVVGHSVGEVAAAHVAGVLSLADAVRVIYHRGRLMQQATGLGKMAAVGLTRADAEQRLAAYPDLSIGAENSPMSLTLSGDEAALAELVSALQAEGIFARMLTVNYAFHSPVMAPFQEELTAALAGLTVSSPSLPIFSTVRGRRAQSGDYDAGYWGRNIREPVLFGPAIQAMVVDGYTACVEVSPHPVLAHSLMQCAPDWLVLPSMRRQEPAQPVLLQSLGSLYTQGYPINWEAFTASGQVVKLPNYPWQNARYWLETKRSRRTAGKPSGHPLLGSRLSTPNPTFEATLDAAQLPVGTVHHLGAVPLLPAAAYLDGLLALGTAVTQNAHLLVEQLTLEKPVLLIEPQTVQWVLTGDTVQIFSLQDDESWQLHAAGSLGAEKATAEAADLTALRSRLQSLPLTNYAQTLQNHNLTFGRERPLLTELWQAEDEALARCHPDLTRREAVDSAIQLLLATAATTELPLPIAAYLLVAAGRVVAHGPYQAPTWCQIKVTPGADDTLIGTITLLDEAGQPILEAADLQFKSVSQADLLPTSIDDWFYEVVWEPAPLSITPVSDSPATGPWLILADEYGIGDHLATRLQTNGQTATVMKAPIALDEVGKTNWSGVVYLWGLDATAVTAADVCTPILSLLHQTDAPLWLVTRQTISVQTGDLKHPFAAPLWGLGRTLALEQPDRWGGLIDLDAGDPEAQAQHTFNEIMADDDEDEVAYREGKRFVARLQSIAPPAEAEAPVTDAGCYLITGGLGNLGLHVARWLVRQGATHLVLTSRSGLPARTEWEALDPKSSAGRRAAAVKELEAAGTAVTVVRADTADEAAMQALFARFGDAYPPLRGVVHAAGVTTTVPLAEMDAGTLSHVLAPKVNGAWLLHELTEKLALDFFVLFSSSAAVLGSGDLGHYAAANCFLDALAQHRRQQGLPALSIDWGWWAGDGMATAELADRFTRIGQNAIPPAQALAAMSRLLTGENAQVMVAAVDWGRFKPIYEAKRIRPLISHMTGNGEAALAGAQNFVADLTATPPRQQHDRLRRHVRTAVAQIMGFDDADTLDTGAGFFTTGMDSVMAVQLRTRLEQSLGQPLPSTVAFEYPTVDKLTDYLFADVLQLETAVTKTESQPQTAPDPDVDLPEDLAGDDLLSIFDDELAAIDELMDS